MENEINDIRTDKELRTVSFSGYKRTDVVKQFYDALVTSKLEEACYWSAELVCSGHYMDLWNTVLLCMAKNIHFGNPKLASYLDMRIIRLINSVSRFVSLSPNKFLSVNSGAGTISDNNPKPIKIKNTLSLNVFIKLLYINI